MSIDLSSMNDRDFDFGLSISVSQSTIEKLKADGDRGLLGLQGWMMDDGVYFIRAKAIEWAIAKFIYIWIEAIAIT